MLSQFAGVKPSEEMHGRFVSASLYRYARARCDEVTVLARQAFFGQPQLPKGASSVEALCLST
jgi:hypothetical protein